MSLLISNALAATDGASTANPIPSLLFFALFMGLMYIVLIRPQRQRQKEQQELINHLAVDDEVLTSGGIVGKIKSLDEGFVDLAISANVTIKVQRAAIVKSFPKGTIEQ